MPANLVCPLPTSVAYFARSMSIYVESYKNPKRLRLWANEGQHQKSPNNTEPELPSWTVLRSCFLKRCMRQAALQVATGGHMKPDGLWRRSKIWTMSVVWGWHRALEGCETFWWLNDLALGWGRCMADGFTSRGDDIVPYGRTGLSRMSYGRYYW